MGIENKTRKVYSDKRGATMLIDIHSHFLPKIDDGSHSVEESMAMLKTAYEQGVTHMVATPHFYADECSVDRFLVRRERSLMRLREETERDTQLPQILCGAEVYYFDGMGKAELLPKLCIGDTRVLLLEMPFTQWTKHMAEEVERIIEKQELQVILAHIERYYDLQKDRGIWDYVMELPVHAQMNGGIFLDWRRRHTANRLLRDNAPILLGSDCHNMTSRCPNLGDARRYIAKKHGDAVLAQTDELGKELLGL